MKRTARSTSPSESTLETQSETQTTKRRKPITVSPNKKAAFVALTKFDESSLHDLKIALKGAGYKLDNETLNPLLVEWLCSVNPEYAGGSKMHLGRLIVDGSHEHAGSIRSKVRDLRCKIRGTSRWKSRAATPVASKAHVAMFVQILAQFDTQKQARAAFKLAMSERFPSKPRKPKRRGDNSDDAGNDTDDAEAEGMESATDGEDDDEENATEEESQPLPPSPPFLWTQDPNHPIALLPFPETELAEAKSPSSSSSSSSASSPRSSPSSSSSSSSSSAPTNLPVLLWANEAPGASLLLYNELNRKSFRSTASIETGTDAGTIVGADIARGFAKVKKTFPDCCGADKSLVDIGSGCGSLAAPACDIWGRYVGFDVDPATVKISLDLISDAGDLSKHAFIALCDVLRMPPVIENAHALHCYLSTMPTESAIFSYALEMLRRSLAFRLFVFHSRMACSADTLSCLELLCAALDPEYRILDRDGKRATDNQIYDHLTGSRESCARKGTLHLQLIRWKVQNANMDGKAAPVGEFDVKITEYCYALRIDARFRRHCNMRDSCSYEHIRRVVERQRNGSRVHAEAVILDTNRLPAVHDTTLSAVIEQSQRFHWTSIAEDTNGSFLPSLSLFMPTCPPPPPPHIPVTFPVLSLLIPHVPHPSLRGHASTGDPAGWGGDKWKNQREGRKGDRYWVGGGGGRLA
jgi:hypothetical protein